jgi:hypothetical protein
MAPRTRNAPVELNSLRDRNRLRRETRTALELAIVSLAPSELVYRLASSAGVLEALVDLPPESAPVAAFTPKAIVRSRAALVEWEEWQRANLEKKMPRG